MCCVILRLARIDTRMTRAGFFLYYARAQHHLPLSLFFFKKKYLNTKTADAVRCQCWKVAPFF